MDSKCKNRNYFCHLRCVFVIILFLPHLLIAQYHFNFEKTPGTGPDLFPGTSWEQVPPDRWIPSMDEPIEGRYSLHHDYDNPESGKDYLIFNHEPIGDSDSLVVSFRIRHGYAPSSSNNWQMGIGADFNKKTMQIQNGIVLGVNFTTSDDLIRIWKCEEGIAEEVFVSPINYQEEAGVDAAPLFRLVCYREGLLRLFYTLDPSVEEPVQVGSCMLDHLPVGRQLVIRYEYSSSRDRNLWFDDLILDANFLPDTLAPMVTGLELMGEKMVKICFSEEILNPAGGAFLLGEIEPELISMEGGEGGEGGEGDDGREVILRFSDPFPNRSPQELRIRNICDRDLNCMKDTLISFMRNEAIWGDVVFSEILADPDPKIRLPDEEYLELYNRSEYPLDLGKWRVEVNSRSYALSGPPLELQAHNYMVLKGMPLPNGGASLALYNEQGKLVHGVSYKVPWDALEWKKEGGWSLESPDPHQLCMVSQWWEYSSDPSGGTPGLVNSNYSTREDREGPLLLYYGYGETGELSIQFSEPLQFTDLDKEGFILRPGSVWPIEASICNPLRTRLDLRFPEDLQERQQFSIDIPVLSDCQGNLSRREKLKGGEVLAASYGALVLNEIMYDPLDGFPEYVELYNPGPGYYDLRDLALHAVEAGASPDHPQVISTHSRIFLPGQFLVLTRCVPQLMEAYGLEPSGSWLEMETFPVLKNTGGSLYLSDRAGAVVDVAGFSDELHLELLGDSKGISLERISWDRSGSEPANWHSAASISGYATPGKVNSQVLDPHKSTELLEVEPEVFSPDGDGFQDILKIAISTGAQGWVITLWISDLTGNMIRNLANNHIAGESTLYSWDGEMDKGGMAPEGIYVVHLLAYHPVSGEQGGRKSAIGVIYR